LVGVHVLIGIVEVFAAERLGFLELIGGNGEVDEEKEAEAQREKDDQGTQYTPEKLVFDAFEHGEARILGKSMKNNGLA
jgi:hypothetical protein